MEDASALHEFDSILTAADGIVLSRGNLGLDVAPEKMARVQKCVISACNLLGAYLHMQRITYEHRTIVCRSCPLHRMPSAPGAVVDQDCMLSEMCCEPAITPISANSQRHIRKHHTT